MWPWRHPLGLNARDFNLGGHEVGGVVHLEVDLGVGAVHGRRLLHAKVGLQREACAGIRAWVSGGLLYHRSSSEEIPSLSSASLISSHVCVGVGTVEFWGGKKRRRTQLEPGPATDSR